MPLSRTNSPTASELLISLDPDAGDALHRQIESALRDAIRTGRLAGGAALPSSRMLAGELGVSRGVVVEAYSQLRAEGYVSSRSGGYTTVAALGAPSPRPAPAQPSPAPVVNFGYGRANVSAFPRSAWLRSARRVITDAPDERLGYLDGKGAPELRVALADYLNRVRGAQARAEDLVVVAGFAQGISLLLSVLAERGATRLAVEDPSSNDDAWLVARRLGLEIVGVPVGRDGIREDALACLEADALLLTPSHQWPTGGVLGAEGRAAAVAWARRTGALLIEDDYDSEYRYDRAPIGALQGLAPDRVVYAGTASKTLAPGLRLGWFVLPVSLVDSFADAKILADRGSPVIDQLTFADFLQRGEFDRHLRRMRPRYRRNRDALVAALSTLLPEWQLAGVAAGLHLVAWLPGDLDEDAVVRSAADHGVGIAGLRPYRLRPSGRGGLIFGYSDLNVRQIGDGVARLADAVAAVRARNDPAAAAG